MNKKTLTLLLLIFNLVSAGKAQISHPHFVSLNIGTNLPLSDYKELDSIALGNANSGLFYSFEAGAYFSKFIGVGLNLGGFSNSVDDEDIIDQLKRNFTDNDQFTVDSKDWSNSYLMVGPYLTFGSQKFMVDLKLLGGIMNSSKPLINVESTTTDIVLSRSNETSSNAFGLNYGVHFRIKLIGTLGLRLNAEALTSSQEFETKVQEIDKDGEVTTTNETLKKEVKALNLGAGLAFTF